MSHDRECPDVEMYDDERDRDALAAKDARITELEAELSTARTHIRGLNDKWADDVLRCENAEAELSTVRNRINELENANTYNRQMVREVTTELSAAREALARASGALDIARQWMPVAPIEGPAIAACFIVDKARTALAQAEAKPQAIALRNEVQVLREALDGLLARLTEIEEHPGESFKQLSNCVVWSGLILLGVCIFSSPCSAFFALESRPWMIVSSPSLSTAYPPAAKTAKPNASSLWRVSHFGGITATAASPTNAAPNTTNPIQLSVSGEARESKKVPIEILYIAAREFLSALMLIAAGFLVAIIWKRK